MIGFRSVFRHHDLGLYALDLFRYSICSVDSPLFRQSLVVEFDRRHREYLASLHTVGPVADDWHEEDERDMDDSPAVDGVRHVHDGLRDGFDA